MVIFHSCAMLNYQRASHHPIMPSAHHPMRKTTESADAVPPEIEKPPRDVDEEIPEARVSIREGVIRQHFS